MAGVEPQSQTVWRQATKYGVPRICYVNKLDRTGANFEYAVNTIRERLNANPGIIQLPIGAEADFIGVVDLIGMRALTWRGETKVGEDYAVEEIPADMLEKAQSAREELIQNIADHDDEFAEEWLLAEEAGEDLSVESIKAGLRRCVLAGTVNAVACGTSFKNKGVQPMLDAVIDYLPSPLDVPAIEGFKPGDESVVLERKPDTSEPLSMLAFKVAADPHLGRLTYVRIYSGILKAGSQVLNATKGKRERIGKIYQMHANKREEISEIGAGMICAVMGLKDTTTGETLCMTRRRRSSSVHGVPQRHRAGDRAEDEVRPEKLSAAIQRLADPPVTRRGDRATSSLAWANS